MEKIKSRWRKNYLEADTTTNDHETKDDNNISNSLDHHNHNSNNNNSSNHHRHHSSKPPTYEPLLENLYLDKRRNEHSRSRKDARSMVCDCILTKEERVRGVMGCLDDCLNRMLMIECGPKCTLGDHCLNKRFQKFQSAKVEVFKTRKKGWGLRTVTDLPVNSFVMEYVGEVVRSKEFRSRVKKYTKQKIKHHYFMALRSDEIIDATVKGNVTRFINHSCEPNCETQKWTVNGDLRIGFFTIRNLRAHEEITFDYQFQRYGRKAQKCYCEAPSCRNYIGGNDRALSLDGHSSPQPNSENKTHKKSFKHGLLLDVTLEDKINALAEDAAFGLKTKDQVIALASLSIKAEEVGDRRKLLDIIKATKSEISLRLFVDYHGLEIICLWMRDPQADCDFKATIIEILEKLPIPNKTKVLESNVYRIIERWATEDLPSDANTTAHTTKALAGKLLKKFQALSPGFKIPRLNRLQRMEIEKKMDQELIKNEATANKLGFDQKNPFASTKTNYFTPAQSIKRKYDSSLSNNIDLTPAPKISKEEHRQQFEMHVRLKDYYDTIEKHYGMATVEQIKLCQRAYTSTNGLQIPYPYLAPSVPFPLLVPQPQPQLPPLPPVITVNSFQTLAYQLNGTSYSHEDRPHKEPEPTEPDKVGTKLEPTHVPKIIVLANNIIEPAHTIDDELAFSICDYDEYYSIRDKPIGLDDVKDNELYPYPGSYYSTPNGETWFATVSLDRKTQQPRTVILNTSQSRPVRRLKVQAAVKAPAATSNLRLRHHLRLRK